ncbi:MAG: hypothetical protein K2N44_11735 [Lachnospiraceae bacterium]|nr:hypothetical protein [Lachnospiraceae bacterium]
MVTLNGCASLDSYIEKRVKAESGILEDENYVNYQSKVASGNVDEEGYYIQNTDQSERIGSIHVTFATNNKLNIQYFEDADRSVAIDTSSYYLNSGDSIYAKVEIGEDISSMYEFSAFDIYEYSETGEKTLQLSWDSNFETTGMVMRIPDNFEGAEISIVPVGKYNSRQISLKDYYIDNDGTEHELDGKWLVNDVEYMDGSVEINPLSSYIVSYQYDKDEFFYVSSEPECYYNNADDGSIIFNQRNADDESVDYIVELHPYIQISMVSGADRIVNVNNECVRSIEANTELMISALKYGDKVLIETDSEWKELENMKSLIWSKTEPLFNKPYRYKYTLIVPEKGGEFLFDPSEYVYDHGSLNFQCYGVPVNDIQRLEKGRRIYFEEKNVEEGYWLPSGEHYIVVGDEEETRQQLKNIKFVQKVQVSVNLKQPVYGGEIIYSIDGKKILSDQVDTYSGTAISMDFEPWEGWICDSIDGTQYIANGNSSQSVTINNVDVDSVFTEDNDHKPALTIVLEKSIGKEMMFDIAASGVKVNEESYNGTWWKSDYKIVDAQKVGTEENIVISMKNKAIPSGEAVKIVVEKTDSDKIKSTSEIRYVDDLTKLQEPIYIYSDSERGESDIWYKTINITISKVDVESFTTYKADSNAIITVKNESTKQELKEGDLIEKSQKVIVTITPKAGYYLLNGNASDKTIYQESMKYSKYLSDIEKIISKHTAEKYCEVMLDDSDSFANYTYTCGKENVSGAVEFKQGEKLTLEYEITDDSHKLKEAAGGFLGIGESDKKVTKSIEITADYNGRTIMKEDFGIEVTGE